MDLKIRARLGQFRPISRQTLGFRICLFISLAFHAGMLAGIQKAFPLKCLDPPRAYRVELLRPPVEDLEEVEPAGTRASAVHPQEPIPTTEEETISLDTQDKRYASYAKIIKEKLMRHWQYPPGARDNLIEGTVRVCFTLTREGSLQNISLLEASSHDVLKRETLRTIRAASPFPPFPGAVTVKRLNINAGFTYQLFSGD